MQVILVLQFFWVFLDYIIGKGIPPIAIAELMFWASIRIAPMSLSIAILLSSIMTMGAIGENSEMAALRSSGVSLLRLNRLLLFVNLLLTIGIFLFNNHIITSSEIQFRKTFTDIKKTKSSFILQEGVFNEDLEKIIIRVEKKTGKNNYEDILVYDHSGGKGNNKVITAKHAEISFTEDGNYLVFKLIDGFEYLEKDGGTLKKNSYTHLTTDFEEKKLFIDFSAFQFFDTDEEKQKNYYTTLKMQQLSEVKDSLIVFYKKRKATVFEPFKKFYEIGDSIKNETLSEEEFIVASSLSFEDTTAVKKTKRIRTLERAQNTLRPLLQKLGSNNKIIHYNNKRVALFDIEWHMRLTTALICFAFFLIGIPLGAVVKKGGFGAPMILALVLFVLYYIFFISFKKMARELSVSPIEGSWFPVWVFGIAGILLFLSVNYNKGISFQKIWLLLTSKK